jgi:hypothetical protein
MRIMQRLSFLLAWLVLAAGTGCNCPCFGTRSTALFSGKDTAAFRGYKQQGFPTSGWTVDNGALKTVPGQGGDIITRDNYKDYDLSFEWKVAPGANSGVIYNVDEAGGEAWHSGPEYQILDDAKHADGRNPKTTAASLYGIIAPNNSKVLKPVGEWNQARILNKKGHVEHWLNGAKVLEYDWNDPKLRETIKSTKFAEFSTFMARPEGHIVFQHHGDEVWFRNIRVKKV